jgi:NAD(P)H-hydrate epimerase
MKILSASQIRELDAYTIEHEPIASIDLMERAAKAFTQWFAQHYSQVNPVYVLCGLGNNGGDGLVIARLLHQLRYTVEVVVIRYSDNTSADFAINYTRLQSTHVPIREIKRFEDIPDWGSAILIDAIFGSGLSRPVAGLAAQVIESIGSSQTVVSVDIPSGLFMDASNAPADCIVKATHTVSFQLPKFAFLLPQNADFVGSWHLVNIGLHPAGIAQAQTICWYTDAATAQTYLHKRKKFSHKGTNGHALLIAGSYGMMGAAILAARACLRSGVGKLTVHAPETANELMQGTVPEALFSADPNPRFSLTYWKPEMLEGIASVGIGPGLGTPEEMIGSIRSLLQCCHSLPMVIDADGLNNLSSRNGRELLHQLPPDTILTPHPKEFQKLLNRTWQNDYEKLELLSDFAVRHRVIVCLKGAHTAVALPDGTIHFNSTGNPGMATGGTGDVLTGILTALLAQKYSPAQAAIFGVYLHGLAGDMAARHKSIYAMMASDLYDYLPEAFLQLDAAQ